MNALALMTTSAAATQKKLNIALALAEKLLPDDVRATLDRLTRTFTHPTFRAERQKALAQIEFAISGARINGQRPDTLHAFRSLLSEGVFIDAMAVLAIESRIAAFKAEHALPAAATVSEHEQP